VPPLEWTARHLALLRCSFAEPTSSSSLPTQASDDVPPMLRRKRAKTAKAWAEGCGVLRSLSTRDLLSTADYGQLCIFPSVALRLAYVLCLLPQALLLTRMMCYPGSGRAPISVTTNAASPGPSLIPLPSQRQIPPLFLSPPGPNHHSSTGSAAIRSGPRGRAGDETRPSGASPRQSAPPLSPQIAGRTPISSPF